VARGLLAVADGHGDVALGRHHVAAGEDARVAGHHVGIDLDHAVGHFEPRHAVSSRTEIDVLAQGQHHRVGLQRFELAGRLREALLVELHLLDGDLSRRRPA
jgi:hypothetical protein